jgi:hypothetical protein
MNGIPQPPIERRAAALADVQQMHDDLISAHDEIGQLKADLARETDRCAMLVEDRNRHRRDGMIYRDKLVELATAMTNIGLLTAPAHEIMRTVRELVDAASDAGGAGGHAKLEQEQAGYVFVSEDDEP